MNLNVLQSLRLVGVDGNGVVAAIGTVTATLVVPNGTTQDQAVISANILLPDAMAYIFDIQNAGTIDDGTHAAKLDIVLQMQFADGTWQDQAYYQAANQAVERGQFISPAFLLPASNGAFVGTSQLIFTSGTTGSKINNTGLSAHGASVTPALAVRSASNMPFCGLTQRRLVAVPRSAAATVGDTITVVASAFVP